VGLLGLDGEKGKGQSKPKRRNMPFLNFYVFYESPRITKDERERRNF
jgi:hypothetical protein